MFKKRSKSSELLDAEHIPNKDLFLCLKELNTINYLLGGYNITINAIKKIIDKSTTHHIVDIGCGGGDTLKHIRNWSKRKGYNVNLSGIDLKATCIDYALQNSHEDISFICDDYRNIHHHVWNVDIIHASLFCHHLTEAEIIDLIRYAISHGAILIINDLERNRFAYYAIKLLTQLFSNSYLIKNDAPLSVLRGFKKVEWQKILEQSGAKKYTIKNKWAFRHEVIVYA